MPLSDVLRIPWERIHEIVSDRAETWNAAGKTGAAIILIDPLGKPPLLLIADFTDHKLHANGGELIELEFLEN